MSRVGRDFAGLTLRLAVGTVLIWAGLGKCCHTMPLGGEQAATLANLGVIHAPVPRGSETTPPVEPADEATEPGEESAPAETPVDGDGDDSGQVTRVAARPAPATPQSDADRELQDRAARSWGRTFTAEDYPEPIEVKRWQGLVLVMHDNQVNAQNRRLVPTTIASNGDLMKYMALVVSWIELVGGFALVAGAMARLAGLLGAGILGGAMWLTQIGPALGSQDAILGFIPDPHLGDPALATTAWATLMLQLLTFACCFTVALLGPGRLSVDHWFWGEKPDHASGIDDDGDDDDD